MNTHQTHHIPTQGPGREVALRWLAQQLRWEHLLAELRNPSPVVDEVDEEEAA
jgi:hypothetical protein